jgi:hypothetical protein
MCPTLLTLWSGCRLWRDAKAPMSKAHVGWQQAHPAPPRGKS